MAVYVVHNSYMAIQNCLVGSPPKPKVLPQRNTVKFSPTIWSDTFISHVSHNPNISEWRKKADILKVEIRKMLITKDKSLKTNGKMLRWIDSIQRLGVAYQFEEEIEEELGNIYEVDGDDSDLSLVALRFRLLREHGYQVASVLCALYRPLRRTLPRIDSRNYISVYEQTHNHSEILLSFAKFDFNILQKLHQDEVCIITKWWKKVDVVKNYPFARDRALECYFWMLLLYSEPQYSAARIFLAKVIAMQTIMDDIYDNYGTLEELELFTTATQRMEISAIVDLPEYMKLFYEALLKVYDEAEEDLRREGKSLYGIKSAKEAMKKLTKTYYEERKWIDEQNLPAFEEYKKVAIPSTGYSMLSITSLVFMGDVANEDAFNWLLTVLKIIEAASTICRLMDDLVDSHDFEQQRWQPPSAIKCYIGEYKGTEEEACEALRGEIEEAWKDINGAFVKPTPVDKSVLMIYLNMARMVEMVNKESDGYTHVSQQVKEWITSLLITNVVH